MLSRASKITRFSRALAIVTAALAGIALAVRPATAQDENAVRVNVGAASAKPGDPIDIPLALSGSEGASVGSILMHIDFPKKLLTYTATERGLAAELAGGEVKVSASDDKDEATQTELELSAKGKNPMKPGILGYLTFNVSDSAPKGVIILKVKDAIAKTPSGGDVELAKGADGQVTILGSDESLPTPGCFFFTH